MTFTLKQTSYITFVLGVNITFMFLVTKIPAITLNKSEDYFLPLIALIFLTTSLFGALIKLNRVLPFLLLSIFILPLTNVTQGASYNVISTGILFGTLFQFRPRYLNLQRNHLYLFGTLIILGLYYNLIPLFFDDGAGFNNKLWFYNISTFLKYIYISLLFIQINPSFKKLLRHTNWFAFIFAGLVILDAFHIPVINLQMKTISAIGFRDFEISSNIALNYFRAAGTGIGPNHSAILMTILLGIALTQYQTFKLTWLLLPILLIGIYLTGSRSGLIMMISTIILWFLYFRDYHPQIQLMLTCFIISLLVVGYGSFNTSFAKTQEIATGRYLLFIDGEKQKTDASYLFRRTELKTAISNLTPFGNRTDNLSTIHSELARLLRFYGILGVTITILFWSLYLILVRKSFLAFSLVTTMALTSFWKWTFHIEAFFIPTIVITTMYLSSLRMVDRHHLCNNCGHKVKNGFACSNCGATDSEQII